MHLVLKEGISPVNSISFLMLHVPNEAFYEEILYMKALEIINVSPTRAIETPI